MKYFLNGTWVNDDTINVLPAGATGLTDQEWVMRQSIPYQPPPLTLAQAQTAQIAIIKADCQKALQSIVASYPLLEMDGWPSQLSEAQAFTANNLAPTPTLSAIATTSGLTVAVIAASVLAKATAFQPAYGAIVGKRKALTASIMAATTVADVIAIIY